MRRQVIEKNLSITLMVIRGGGSILILTESGAGDFIAMTGAIREIRRIYPDAYITLSAHPRSLKFAECCPYVDEVILDPQDFPTLDIVEIFKSNIQTSRKLLGQRFDICFAFAIHPTTPLLMYMSGAKIRLTLVYHENLGRMNNNTLIAYVMKLATHVFPCSTYGGHIADDSFSLIENVTHLPITNRKLEVWYTPADVGIAKTFLNGVSGIIYSLNMGGNLLTNHYPPEKYAKFLEMILTEEPTANFVILGGGQADLKSAAIIKNVAPAIYDKKIIDLTNKISYRQSAAVLKFCKVHIGNDTGTMHVAAAVDCPVLLPNCFAADLPTFPTDVTQCWYPYGVPSVIIQPEHALSECKNLNFHHPHGCAANVSHCITQIKPETLFKGFHLLKERAAKKICEPLFIH